MTSHSIVHDAAGDLPVVRKITVADLRIALVMGGLDFWEAPSHMIFLSLIYPVFGLFLGRLLIGADVTPMLFPLAVGFALIGPFAAVGLYELSRRRDRGLSTSWRHAFDVLHSPSRDALLALGMTMILLFLVWMTSAWAIYRLLVGEVDPESASDFVELLFATPAGLALLALGTLLGVVFAMLALAIGAVSIPLLLDRPVGVMVALDTSVRAVIVNPTIMALWGLVVLIALVIGTIPVFIGLSIIMPVLAHATWHLYRRVVVP